MVVCEIEKVGGVVKEFNIIVVDDGIVMGYDGMFYLLLSCEIIVDSVEYMVNVYCVDVMVCIFNCDKIMLGMMMVVMCLNILVIFVFGGLMEVGKVDIEDLEMIKIDFVDVMVVVVDDKFIDEQLQQIEENVCLICGLCLGMFIVNLMNCLVEVFGFVFLGNGLILVIYVDCKVLFFEVGCCIVEIIKVYYEDEKFGYLLCEIVIFEVFENVMLLDIVMGGLINMILYLMVIVYEGKVDFIMNDIDCLLCKVFCLCKVVLNIYNVYMEDVYCVGGIFLIFGELYCGGLINENVFIVYLEIMGVVIVKWDIKVVNNLIVNELFKVVLGGVCIIQVFSQLNCYKELDIDCENGVICLFEYVFLKEGGLVVLFGNIVEQGCIVKIVGVDELIYKFIGVVKVYES